MSPSVVFRGRLLVAVLDVLKRGGRVDREG